MSKKVFLTGATGGIGKCLAKYFSDLGDTIICTSTSEDKLSSLEKEIGSSHFYIKLDLSDQENLSSNLENIINDHKDIDVLINNAGSNMDNIILRMKEDEWNRVFDININSNFKIIKKILPNMVKNRKGRIIGISSVVALTGNAGQSNYTASKSAMIGMYKSIAQEVAKRNITVNVVAPGFIETEMTSRLNESQTQLIKNKIPMNRFGKAEEVANLVLYLASDEASYITGQTLHINGGMLMV